jgi:hypothetical protein
MRADIKGFFKVNEHTNTVITTIDSIPNVVNYM